MEASIQGSKDEGEKNLPKVQQKGKKIIEGPTSK